MAARAVLADSADTFSGSAQVFVSQPSVASHQAGLDAALASHDHGLQQVATGTVGASPTIVYEVTTVEQFDSAAQAVAFNQRIYEVRCAEGDAPNTASSTVPGEFLIPQCGCVNGAGNGYTEMSLAIGRLRVGIDDYDTQRTDQQVVAFAEEVLAAASDPTHPTPSS